MSALEVAGPVTRHLRGRVGQRLHAQGVGQASGGVDGDHAGAPTCSGRSQRERGRHRRLAHASRSAAHDHRALGHQLGQRRRRARAGLARRARRLVRAHRAPSATSPVTPSASAPASRWVSAGPIDAASSAGTSRWGAAVRGPVARSAPWRPHGAPSGSAAPPRGRPGGLAPGSPPPRAAAATSATGRSRPTGSGSQALTMTGPSCTPALSSRV